MMHSTFIILLILLSTTFVSNLGAQQVLCINTESLKKDYQYELLEANPNGAKMIDTILALAKDPEVTDDELRNFYFSCIGDDYLIRSVTEDLYEQIEWIIQNSNDQQYQSNYREVPDWLYKVPPSYDWQRLIEKLGSPPQILRRIIRVPQREYITRGEMLFIWKILSREVLLIKADLEERRSYRVGLKLDERFLKYVQNEVITQRGLELIDLVYKEDFSEYNNSEKLTYFSKSAFAIDLLVNSVAEVVTNDYLQYKFKYFFTDRRVALGVLHLEKLILDRIKELDSQMAPSELPRANFHDIQFLGPSDYKFKDTEIFEKLDRLHDILGDAQTILEGSKREELVKKQSDRLVYLRTLFNTYNHLNDSLP